MKQPKTRSWDTPSIGQQQQKHAGSAGAANAKDIRSAQFLRQQAIIDKMHLKAQMAAHDVFQPDLLPAPHIINATKKPPDGGWGGIG